MEGTRRYWEAERPAREAERAAVRDAAAAEIGPLTEREILIAGATAYWCEGTKSKPSRRNDRVAFINSDPALILLFLRFLATVGISPDRLVFRVYIHENADAERSPAILAAHDRREAGAVPPHDAQASQSKDCSQERRGRVLRLPSHRRSQRR